MIAVSDMLDLLVRSSLLLTIVWIAAALVKKAGGSAAMRHMVWLLGLAAVLMLPLLSALMPPLRFPIPDALATPPSIAVSAGTAAFAVASPIPAEPLASVGTLLLLLYLVVAAVLLGRLAAGHYFLTRLWRRASPILSTEWVELTKGLAARLGIQRQIALRIATGPVMPMTWGTFRPRILLPAEAFTWTDDRRRVVLLHELAHVARRDSLSRWAASIICTLYWPHPAIWVTARRMRLEQEHACDDLVLSVGTKASLYAQNLLDVAGAFRPSTTALVFPVAMAHASELERRLVAIVRHRPRHRSSAGFVAGTGMAAMLTTLMTATAVPVAFSTPMASGPIPEAISASSAFALGRNYARLPEEHQGARGPEDFRSAQHDPNDLKLKPHHLGPVESNGQSGFRQRPERPARLGRPAVAATTSVPPTPYTPPTPRVPLTPPVPVTLLEQDP